MLYSALFKFTPTITNEAHRLINKEALYQMLLEFIMELITNNTVLCLYNKIFQHNVVAIITISLLQ